MSDKFTERQKGFEKKFARDEELQFKINAKTNKYIAEWVSEILEFDDDKKVQYIQDVIKADFAEAGDEDVFRKIKIDLQNKNIEDDQIRLKMKELNEKAKSDFM